MITNYYFDPANSLKPYTYCLEANSGSLPPANATRLEPEMKDGFWPCWDGEKWIKIEDHRDLEGWLDGQPFTIESLGPLPEEFSQVAPEVPFNPGSDYEERDGEWWKIRFTKKEYLLLCGIAQVGALNAAINAGNVLAKTIHDLLMAADYIDVTDLDTIQMVQLLTTEPAGSVLTAEQAADILQGVKYELAN